MPVLVARPPLTAAQAPRAQPTARAVPCPPKVFEALAAAAAPAAWRRLAGSPPGTGLRAYLQQLSRRAASFQSWAAGGAPPAHLDLACTTAAVETERPPAAGISWGALSP